LSKTKLRIYSGWKANLIRIKNRFQHIKYLLQKKKYPLFILNREKGGLLKTYQLQKKLKMKKLISFNNHIYFSLTIPKFPSKAYDNMVAKGGLNIMAAGTPIKAQVDNVMLAITQKCEYKCQHCYEALNISKEDTIPLHRWNEVIKELQTIGTSIITLTGGEPLLVYDDVLKLLDEGNKDLSDFHIHTSGCGLTLDKAKELKQSGLTAAGIGLDDFKEERHDRTRGYAGAFKEAVQALRFFYEADVFTYINMCLSKDLVRSGGLREFYSFLKDLNVGYVRLLEPKPWGGYFNMDIESLFTEDDRQAVTDFFISSIRKKEYQKYPPVSYLAYIEAPERMGCLMGGISHFYIDSRGNVEPCVFLPVSFGNIMEESFPGIYERMREAIPHPLHKQCPSIYLSDKSTPNKVEVLDAPIPFNDIEKEWRHMFEG